MADAVAFSLRGALAISASDGAEGQVQKRRWRIVAGLARFSGSRDHGSML
jgi:hypothetical protein